MRLRRRDKRSSRHGGYEGRKENIMKKDKEVKEQVINEVNPLKERLGALADKLYEAGYIRKAESLLTIVGDLEHWQHTR